MFKAIAEKIPRDHDFPLRTWALDVRRRLLDGTFYDHLAHAFDEERDTGGGYIRLRDRRPSVQFNLSKAVVDDIVGMLFSDGHFPQLRCDDEKTRTAFAVLIRETRLAWTMIEAATLGSVGSVAIRLRILRKRVFFDVFDTRYLTPVWDPEQPDTLLRISERYKTTAAGLAALGYQVDPDDNSVWWFGRDWDANAETWYLPWTAERAADKDFRPVPDVQRTVSHQLGFVPWVWIRNLPGGDAVDGACTFSGAVTQGIEIDYQLSQLGRGLRYSSDPTVVLKEPLEDGPVAKGAANPIVVDRDGDAKLLEISGNAAAAVIDYVRLLRELALEACHGNRADADKIAAVQSGRAMELMYHSLLLVADKLRISYGDGGLLALLELVQQAVRHGQELQSKSGEPLEIDPKARLHLGWPRWFPPTSHDLLESSQAYQVLRAAALLSQETGVSQVAEDLDLPDAVAELTRIRAEPPPPAPAGAPSPIKENTP